MARYFYHTPPNGSPKLYWRDLSFFAGEEIHINFNLLAHAVGDNPDTLLPDHSKLVAPQDYLYFQESSVMTPAKVVIPALQPFVFSSLRSGMMQQEENADFLALSGSPHMARRRVQIGPKLQHFLDAPLGGETMNLSLPFNDSHVTLGSKGAGMVSK